MKFEVIGKNEIVVFEGDGLKGDLVVEFTDKPALNND